MLQGIFTPLLTPVDDSGRIAEAELRRHVSWLIEKGAHGLYANGSSGEFPRFASEERLWVSRIAIDEAAGRVPVLAGAAAPDVRGMLAECEALAQLGARAVPVVPPFYYKVAPETSYAYFAELARHTPIDLVIYHIPAFASPMDVATICRLAEEFPRIIGIKESSGDMSFMMRLMAAIRPVRGDFALLTGWEAVLVPMLLVGCDGGAHASGNVVPELLRSMYDLVRGGRAQEAIALQLRFEEFFYAMIEGFEFPDGFRAAAEMRGFRFGPGRLPQTEAQQARRAELAAKLANLLETFVPQAAAH